MKTSILELTEQFLLWREHSQRGRIPNVLKQQAVDLLQVHSEKELSQRLNIQLKTVQKWQKKPKKEGLKFIKLKTEKADNGSSFNSILTQPVVTLLLPNEIKLILSGQSIKEMVEFTVVLSERMKA